MAVERVACHCCGATESLDVAKEAWAATYMGGLLVNWICDGCWHSVEREFERA